MIISPLCDFVMYFVILSGSIFNLTTKVRKGYHKGTQGTFNAASSFLDYYSL